MIEKKEQPNYLEQLSIETDKLWKVILNQSPLVAAIKNGKLDKKLYAIYLLETYHYTRHNPRNQALVAVRNNSVDHAYTRYCLRHAEEEVGHERMALNDLLSITDKKELPELKQPLPETEVLISYLYWISFQGNPIQRLGYSFWAENCYQYINPIISQLKELLGLRDNQLTFFVAHAHIDKDHADEVKSMINRYCISKSDYEDIFRVLKTSLQLTGRILDGVYEEYLNLIAGKSSQYSFLLNF